MPINALLHLLGTYDKQTDLFKASFSGLYFVEQYLRMMHLTLLFEVVGPVLTEFPIGRMAFGQPSLKALEWPRARCTEKNWSIVVFMAD